MGIMLAGYVSVLIMSIIVQGGISTIISDSEQGGRLNFFEWVQFKDKEKYIFLIFIDYNSKKLHFPSLPFMALTQALYLFMF